MLHIEHLFNVDKHVGMFHLIFKGVHVIKMV